MSNDTSIIIDRYPFNVWPPTEYCNNCDARLWKQSLIKKTNEFNTFYKCPYCRETIKTEETKPKIEKVETIIETIPVIVDYTLRQPVTTESVFDPYDVSEAIKDIEPIDFTPEKEESIPVLLVKIILQLFFLYFILRIGWMFLIHSS
jgi:hypothetical protein